MQRGVAKGLKVPCLFMITEVSIRCQKNPEVGIRVYPPIHHWLEATDGTERRRPRFTKYPASYHTIILSLS